MTAKHPRLDHFTSLLERVLLGRAAAKLHGAGPFEEEEGTVHIWTLPAWIWVRPRIDVGRKDINPNGGRYLLPLRVAWRPGHVIMSTGDSRAGMTGVGLGYGLAAVSTLSTAGTHRMSEVHGEIGVPHELSPSWSGSSRMAKRELKRIKRDGDIAYWEVLAFLEGWAERALGVAAWASGQDLPGVTEATSQPLDSISLEALKSEMVYGIDGAHDSPVQRMVERCIHPRAFTKVDPERYMSATIRRDARAVVRRALGDPHVGSKIRRLAQEHDWATVEDLVQLYREIHPADKVSTDRVLKALSVVADPTVDAYSLDEMIGNQLPEMIYQPSPSKERHELAG